MSNKIEPKKGTELAEMMGGASFGLEDFDATDVGVARIKIAHVEAKFEDSSTGIQYDELTGVALGLVKQRTLWPTAMEEDPFPLCKSLDAKYGHPSDDFPWKAAGDVANENGLLVCSTCRLREWGSHPARDTSWCGEQWLIPFMLEEKAGGSKMEFPVVLMFKSSAIGPTKKFLQGAQRRGVPLLIDRVRIGLEARKRGTIKYAVPNFEILGSSDENNWEDYAVNYRQIREYLQTPRDLDSAVDDGDSPKLNVAEDNDLDDF